MTSHYVFSGVKNILLHKKRNTNAKANCAHVLNYERMKITTISFTQFPLYFTSMYSLSKCNCTISVKIVRLVIRFYQEIVYKTLCFICIMCSMNNLHFSVKKSIVSIPIFECIQQRFSSMKNVCKQQVLYLCFLKDIKQDPNSIICAQHSKCLFTLQKQCDSIEARWCEFVHLDFYKPLLYFSYDCTQRIDVTQSY